ncbi:MAG TPA: UbiD family decarboxylase [Anaerolineae bacterium]
MDLHEFIAAAEAAGHLVKIEDEVDPHLELARRAAGLDGRPVLFRRVAGSAYPVLIGACSDRRYFGMALDVPPDRLIFRLAAALAAPQAPPALATAACREVCETAVDLAALPFLTHYPTDGGAYATAAVVFIDDPDTGPNASYHRLLRLDHRRLAARLVERRGTDSAWRKAIQGDGMAGPPAVRPGLPVAIGIGLPLHVLLAASMAPAPGVDEMTIAQALAPTPMATCANGIRVPAAAEFVLEGRITADLVNEGPFVDLTGTYDFVRRQPVIEIERITHRRDAVYQALLPGRLEHRLLMGMPREPTIYAEVNRVACCRNVHITPGGASWLHAVVQIAKQAPDDGRQAVAAAFRGHGSLKHVVVVDEDVDIFDPSDVEWAIATRFQADRGLWVFPDEPASSLDPSAHHTPGQKSRSAKMGLDATIAWDTPAGPRDPAAFRRVKSGD